MAAQLLVVLRAGRGHRWPTLPNLWRGNAVQLVLLAVALSAANYARTAISPLQEQIRLALALSDNQIGLLQGPAMALPVALGAVPLGLLVDRVSRARLLIVLVTLTTLANGFSALAPSFGALLAARCSIGLTAAATSITVLSLLADRYAPAQRGRATMVVTVGEVGGASGAFALGGWLLGESGPDRWHAAMLWLTVPLVIATLSMLLLSEPARSRVAIDPRSLRGAFEELWRYRRVILPLLSGKILVGTAYGAVVIWTAPTLFRRFALSPDRIGGLMATGLLISGLLGPIVGGFLADLCQRSGGPRRTMLCLSGLALLSAVPGCFALMPTGRSAGVSMILYMTLVSVIGVTEMTVTTVVVPNEVRGLCLSVLIAAGLVFGVGLAPMIVSLLSGAIGGAAMIGAALAVVCSITGVLGAITFALGRRFLARVAE